MSVEHRVRIKTRRRGWMEVSMSTRELEWNTKGCQADVDEAAADYLDSLLNAEKKTDKKGDGNGE